MVAGREVSCLPLTQLDILLEKSLCLGSRAKVIGPYHCSQLVTSILHKGSQKERQNGPTLLCLPACLLGGAGSGAWLMCHTSATRSTWACCSGGLSSCSAGGQLLAELGNLLVYLLQSLPPKLVVILQNFMHGKPLLRRFLSEWLGGQGSFPDPSICV